MFYPFVSLENKTDKFCKNIIFIKLKFFLLLQVKYFYLILFEGKYQAAFRGGNAATSMPNFRLYGIFNKSRISQRLGTCSMLYGRGGEPLIHHLSDLLVVSNYIRKSLKKSFSLISLNLWSTFFWLCSHLWLVHL